MQKLGVAVVVGVGVSAEAKFKLEQVASNVIVIRRDNAIIVLVLDEKYFWCMSARVVCIIFHQHPSYHLV